MSLNSDPKGLGYKVDVHDPRDFRYGTPEARLGSVLEAPDLRPFILGVRDQHGTSSCSGQATVGAFEVCAGAQGRKAQKLSALWQYVIGREAERPPPAPDQIQPRLRDDGGFLRLLLQASAARGAVPEDVRPFSEDEATVNGEATPDECVQAFALKGTTYSRISPAPGKARVEAIDDALFHGCPQVIGMQVSAAFQRNKGEIVTSMGASIGGHAMAIVGSTPEGYWILNSWGTSFGRRGLALFSRDFMASCEIQDHYAISGVPDVE